MLDPMPPEDVSHRQIWVQLAERIVVKSALTTAQQNQIEGYLAHKWGLTANLPAGHPYKTTPPYV